MFDLRRFILKYNLPKIAFVLSCLLLLVIFLFNPHYIYTTGIVDQWFAVKGLIFYKEFSEFHFPFGYLASIPLRLVTNWNFELDPFLGLFIGVGTLTLLYKIGIKILTPFGNIVSLLFFAIFFWYAATGIIYYDEILIGFLISVLLHFIFNINLKNSKTTSYLALFLVGIIFSLTEFSGQIATLTLGVFFLYLTYLIYQFKKPIFVFWSAYLHLIAGITSIVSIFFLYFIFNNAFKEFFYSNITYYFQYAEYEKNIFALPRDQMAYYFSPLLIIVFTVLVKLITRKQISQTQGFLLVSSLSTVPFIIFGVYHPHHLSYALPVLAITAGSCVNFKEKSSLLKIISFAMIIIPSIVAVLAIIPWHMSRVVFPPSLRIFNDVYPQDISPINDISSWLEVNASPDDKILVLGSPIVYIKTNLLPSSRPSKGMPHSWEPIGEISKEILSAPPDYWIVDQQFITRLRTNYPHFSNIMPFIDNEMLNCYRLEKSFNKWQIWSRDSSCKILI